MNKIILLSSLVPNTTLGKHLIEPEKRLKDTVESVIKWGKSKKENNDIEFLEITTEINQIKHELIYSKIKKICEEYEIVYKEIVFNEKMQKKASLKGAGYSELIAIDEYFKKNRKVGSILKVSARYYPDDFEKFEKAFLNGKETYIGSHYLRKVNSVYLWMNRCKFYEEYDNLFGYVDDRHGRYIEHAYYKISIGNEFHKDKKNKSSGWESYNIKSGSVKKKKNKFEKLLIRMIYRWL